MISKVCAKGASASGRKSLRQRCISLRLKKFFAYHYSLFITHYSLFIVYYSLFIIHCLSAQQKDSVSIVRSNSLSKSTQNDTLPAFPKEDSLKNSLTRMDSTRSYEGLDTLIFYGADTTEGTLDNSTVVLKNNAWVRYRGMEIRAARITIEQPKKLMTAEAVPDSVDSTGRVLRYRGIPQFTEGGESFTGNKMEYTFDTRRGRVLLGETKLQDGFYYGENIRKLGDSSLYIRKGRFTTCDQKDPHFYFQTQEMKMIVRDQVVAKPIVLYIHDVPIFAIPFGVFPNKAGRSSGITPPSYNETPREGKQVRNFGYYWAPNDYFDALAQIDFLDKAGFLFHGGTRYAKRYYFTGSFNFSYSSLSYITGEKNRLWSLDESHSQTLSERSNLNADLHFVSSKNFYQFTSINQQQILNRQIRSNISYNNSSDWGGISANVSQSKNLDNGQRDLTLPSITISKSSAAFFPKSDEDKDKPDLWYQSIRYSYNSNGLYKETQAQTGAPTLRAAGMNHAIGISAPFKIFKYFNFSPSLSIQETWFDRRSENYSFDSNNKSVSDTVRSFFARHTFTGSIGVSTKIYGTANPRILGLESMRHIMTPSVSLNYHPDFSKRTWGYYETATDTGGRKVKLDRYAGNILFGGTTAPGRSLAMGFSLAHVLQAKVLTSEKDTSKSVPGNAEPGIKKLDLINFNNSISYDFESPQFKLSTLSTSVTVSNDLAKSVSLSLNMNHDFYRYDRQLNRRVNKLNKLPRLLSASITSGISFNGGGKNPTAPAAPAQPAQNYSAQPFQQGYNSFTNPASVLPAGIPWSARFDFNYDINKSNPNSVTKTFGVNTGANLKLTPNWQVNYTARYDILHKEFVSQSFSFLRDLHCWEMRFEWTPTGPAAGYFFIVQIKSPTLRDIKLQRTDYGNQIFQ